MSKHKSREHARAAAKERHFACTDCDHRWSLSPEGAMRLMWMTPVCEECGSMSVTEVAA